MPGEAEVVLGLGKLQWEGGKERGESTVAKVLPVGLGKTKQGV